MDDATLEALEHFVCALYGYPSQKSINVVRAKLFEKKYTKEGKMVDMALLPPCQSVLILHKASKLCC